ncbi:MAG: hypothetical protein KGR48_00825 [Alphaproteobacteria bacterium]|nr:hypothetical protein [Alphaproteobacteria bacterium]MDE2074231.1 hypothetical protein [Alphaproteobacteria bacterium]MDE2352237.1 hypothetical protein [Alphaproteobacteria bacterium]
MAKKNQSLADAQQFVKNVLAKHFNQQVRGEALRVAAEKIVEAIPATPESREKKAA